MKNTNDIENEGEIVEISQIGEKEETIEKINKNNTTFDKVTNRLYNV